MASRSSAAAQVPRDRKSVVNKGVKTGRMTIDQCLPLMLVDRTPDRTYLDIEWSGPVRTGPVAMVTTTRLTTMHQGKEIQPTSVSW